MKLKDGRNIYTVISRVPSPSFLANDTSALVDYLTTVYLLQKLFRVQRDKK
jgi:hypothetical protein